MSRMQATIALPPVFGGRQPARVRLATPSGGIDIANSLTELTLTARPGELTTLTVDLSGTIVTEADVDVQLSESTRDLLVTLGWSPPSSADDHVEQGGGTHPSPTTTS